MCLYTSTKVEKPYGNCTKLVPGYKFFRYRREGLFPAYMSYMCDSPYRVKTDYFDDSVCEISDDFGHFYPAGFHIFTSVPDALSYFDAHTAFQRKKVVLVKVVFQLRSILAYGYHHKAISIKDNTHIFSSSIIANHMRIEHAVDKAGLKCSLRCASKIWKSEQW